MAPIKKLFYAINFLQRPYWTTEEFVVVPSKWISYIDKQAMVAFPQVDKPKFASYIKKRRSPCKSWPDFPVTVEYKSDLYKDVVLYVRLRQRTRSWYVRSVTAAAVSAGQNIQVVEAPPTTLYEASHLYPPGASLSEVQIEKKAMKHELLMNIAHKLDEVKRLLEDYINLKDS